MGHRRLGSSRERRCRALPELPARRPPLFHQGLSAHPSLPKLRLRRSSIVAEAGDVSLGGLDDLKTGGRAAGIESLQGGGGIGSLRGMLSKLAVECPKLPGLVS